MISEKVASERSRNATAGENGKRKHYVLADCVEGI